MNLDEILLWLEGTTLEFKCELGSPEPFLKTIVAFSSTAGGTVMIDIEDRTRRVVGVGEPLALEARLANLISDTVRSRLAPDIEILPCERQILLPCDSIPALGGRTILRAPALEQSSSIRILDLAFTGGVT